MTLYEYIICSVVDGLFICLHAVGDHDLILQCSSDI